MNAPSRFSGLLLSVFVLLAAVANADAECIATPNGWYEHNGKVIWGYAQHNGWWGGKRDCLHGQQQAYKVRTAVTRNAPGQSGPSLTEDLNQLTDAMSRYAYPGFEHNFGLWYDRRRDCHDTVARTDPHVESPLMEQPWARSEFGRAADGLAQYDLTKWNDWYFDRLKEFAQHCDAKGTILFHNFYMQHALLETQAHYIDFPWRSANCLQATGMPDRIPAANAFYDVSHPTRRGLHAKYIWKCLDELSAYNSLLAPVWMV